MLGAEGVGTSGAKAAVDGSFEAQEGTLGVPGISSVLPPLVATEKGGWRGGVRKAEPSEGETTRREAYRSLRMNELRKSESEFRSQLRELSGIEAAAALCDTIQHHKEDIATSLQHSSSDESFGSSTIHSKTGRILGATGSVFVAQVSSHQRHRRDATHGLEKSILKAGPSSNFEFKPSFDLWNQDLVKRQAVFDAYKKFDASEAPRVQTPETAYFSRLSAAHQPPHPLLAMRPPTSGGQKEGVSTSRGDAQHRGVGDDTAAALAAACGEGLEGSDKLGLRGCRLTAGSMKVIGESLCHQKCMVKKLDVSENRLGNEGFETLLEVLEQNVRERPLEELLVSDINVVGDIHSVTSIIPIGKHLTLLDISHNCLKGKSGSLLAELLASTKTLRTLDCSWNSLAGKCAAEVFTALEINCTLTSLNMAWNGAGDVGASALADALATNSTLSRLDISNNRIHDVGCFLLGYGLRRNKGTLTDIQLNNNPIGQSGGPAILRNLRTMGGAARTIGLIECSHNASSRVKPVPPENKVFTTSDPGGMYSLQLDVAHDRAIASELWECGIRDVGENWIGERLNGSTIDVSESTDDPLMLWPEGLLTLKYQSSPPEPSEELIIPSNQLEQLMNMLADSETSRLRDKDRVAILTAAGREFCFTTEQLMQAVCLLNDEAERVKLCRDMFLCLVDTPLYQSESFSGTMSDAEQASVEQTLGNLYFFEDSYPTNHYTLDLSLQTENWLAARLMQLGNREALMRASESRVNTSQNGDFHPWRNIVVNSEPSTLGHVRKLLSTVNARGVLDFDYASTLVPAESDRSKLMERSLYQSLKQDLKKVLANVTELRWSQIHLPFMNTGCFVTPEQLIELCMLFPVRKHAAIFFQKMFQRCVRHYELWPRMCHLPWEFIGEVVYRIGVLNIWHPLNMDGHISLDLSKADERSACQILVELSVVEPEENWKNETYSEWRGPSGFELPERWVGPPLSEPKVEDGCVPSVGVVSLTYTTPTAATSKCKKSCMVPARRLQLLELCLASETLTDGVKNQYLRTEKVIN